MNNVKVLDIRVDLVDFDDTINHIKNCISNQQYAHIITLNAEMVMYCHKDPDLKNIINSSSLVIPDGIGVVWALRRKGFKINRLPGIELVDKLFEISQKQGYRIFLLGSKPEVLEKAYDNIINKYRGINIVGIQHGYFTESEEELIINNIKRVFPDILLVALGVPKQEKWIAKYQSIINVPICIGVGGTFDVLSGDKKRAPVFIQKCHMEWLYRLCQEPSRWKRMLVLPKFVKEVLTSDR